jgi:hypothetical protein
MQNEMVTKLATDQALILNGPGAIKINAVKTVAMSKVAGSKAAASHLGSSGVASLSAIIPTLTPLFGFITLSVGALLLVKMWAKK